MKAINQKKHRGTQQKQLCMRWIYCLCYVIIVSVFWPFLSSLSTNLTVWCACQTLLLTEETDSVKCHTTDVSFESATPARCVK